MDLQEELVPRKELEEVPKCQTEDPIQERATGGLSEVEQDKRSYCRSRRRMSGDIK